MPYCIVKSCKNRGKIPGVSYHRVYGNEKDWMELIKRTPTKNFSRRSVICSNHFLPSDLIKYENKVMIREGAVPTLYLSVAKNTSVSSVLSAPSSLRKLEFNVPEKVDLIPEITPTVPEAEDTRSIPSSSKYVNLKAKEIEKSYSSDSTESISSTTNIHLDVADKNLITEIHNYSQSSGPLKRKKNIVAEEAKAISLTSSSSDSLGLKHSPKKRRRDVRTFHNYSTSPRKTYCQLQQQKKTLSVTKNKLRVNKQHIRRLKKQVRHLADIVKDLRDNRMMSDNSLQHLEEMFNDIPLAIIRRSLTTAKSGKTSHATYPMELRKFAMTLQFYSPKAYEYVRSTFNKCLPHQETIRKWTSAVDCDPGFSKLCFDTLKVKVEEENKKGKEVICALMVDEMSIMKQMDCVNGKAWGYVDLGTGVVEDKFATQALVIMVVAVNDGWKLPVAYFLISSLNAEERANIILECLTRLANVGVKIISLTCDGPTVNFSMLQSLGCNVRDIFNIKSSFKHPTQEHDVNVILDACHMLKLLRNKWSFLQTFKDPDGNLIEFEYIKKLHQIQESEKLYAANKLRKKHLEWQRQKMKVSLAAQTLSASVATALEFAMVDLKLEEFKDCGPTIRYIRLVDELFDILNSKNPFAKGFKSAMRQRNEHFWRKTLNNAIHYFSNCTDIKGIPLHKTPRKTPIFGFIITIQSIISIFDTYVKPENGPLQYLLTFKFSQDHLELFFCAMRARNGWNNNPSALKFHNSYKKLLLHNVIRGSNQANVQQESTEILFSLKNTVKEKNLPAVDISDMNVIRKYNIDINDDLLEEHSYGIPISISLSEYSENIVTYVSGYVVRMVRRAIKCITCLDAIAVSATETPSYTFLNRKQKGGLVVPSEGVVKICSTVEKKIRRMLSITNGRLPTESSYLNSLINCTLNEFLMKNIFPSLEDHIYDSAIGEELHIKRLISTIVKRYCKIRLNSISKQCTEEVKGSLIRKQLSKLILFKNQ